MLVAPLIGTPASSSLWSIDNTSNVALHSLIESYVARALDEQKANAKGIPPIATSAAQGESAPLYVRHELVQGVWRKMTTPRRYKP